MEIQSFCVTSVMTAKLNAYIKEFVFFKWFTTLNEQKVLKAIRKYTIMDDMLTLRSFHGQF